MWYCVGRKGGRDEGQKIRRRLGGGGGNTNKPQEPSQDSDKLKSSRLQSRLIVTRLVDEGRRWKKRRKA